MRAIVFDFDGVLADTEPLHYAAFAEVLARRSIPLSEFDYRARYLGLADPRLLHDILADAGRAPDARAVAALLEEKNAVYMSRLDAACPQLPGVPEFVTRMAARMPLAICSGARRAEILSVLARLGLEPCFAAIVAGEDTPTSKPDPTGFRLAVRRLAERAPDLSPSACLAIEDSLHGITAARAAGLRVLALTTSHPADALAAADACVTGLDRVSDALLDRLFTDPS